MLRASSNLSNPVMNARPGAGHHQQKCKKVVISLARPYKGVARLQGSTESRTALDVTARVLQGIPTLYDNPR